MKDGHFHSVNDVIAQSLGKLHAQEEFIRANVPELRGKIAVGVEQLKRGNAVDGRKAIQNLREKQQRRQRGEK